MTVAWPIERLGNVLKPVSRDTAVDPNQEYRLLGVRLDGLGPFHRETVLGAQTSAKKFYEVRENDFIYSRLFAWRGAFGVIDHDLSGCHVSNEFPIFAPIAGRIDIRFLRYWFRLRDVLRRVEADCSGSTPLTRNRYKEQFFLSLEIPLPPIEEQHRIVARIEALTVKVSEARDIRTGAARELVALSSSASKVRLENPAWPRHRLEELCDVITDGTHQTPRYVDEGATFLSAQNVKPFRFIPEIHRKVSWEDFAGYTARNKPRKGDVLLTRVGAGIGEAAVVDQDIEFAIYVSVALIRTNSKRLMPEFLVHWLNSPNGTEQSRGQTLGRGHSQGNLNLNLLRGFQVPVPSLEEQGRIVTELDGIRAKADAIKRLQSETAMELDAMVPAVLDKAFRGEL